MQRDVEITVYDKHFTDRGTIGKFQSCQVVPRFNMPGQATIVMAADHRRVADLIQPGARVRLEAEGVTFTGPVKSFAGTGPHRASTMTFTIDDDFRVLEEFLCWVIPTQPIEQQGSAGEHDRRTGPAETVLKNYVTANAVNRLGMPLVVTPTQGRGPQVDIKMRFYTVYEKMFPVVDGAGLVDGTLGFSVVQDGKKLRVDCYATKEYPVVLSEEAGTITEWSFTHHTPTVTDVVIGGQGEAQLRNFRTIRDAARATEYNRRIERFRDARDVEDPTLLYARGQETLDEGRPKAGLSVTLSESNGFRYGKSVRVGDRVRVQVAPDITIGPEILREAPLTFDADGGYRIVPTVGERQDETGGLVKAVRDVARFLRRRNV